MNIEEFEIKEEIVSIKVEILPSSTAEDTCTFYLQKDDIKMEDTEKQGNFTKECIMISENWIKMSKKLLKIIKWSFKLNKKNLNWSLI